jgi:hypothetical protein
MFSISIHAGVVVLYYPYCYPLDSIHTLVPVMLTWIRLFIYQITFLGVISWLIPLLFILSTIFNIKQLNILKEKSLSKRLVKTGCTLSYPRVFHGGEQLNSDHGCIVRTIHCQKKKHQKLKNFIFFCVINPTPYR